MSDTVIAAIISGIFVAIPSLIATITLNNRNNSIMQYRLQDLTKQVEKHNSVIERMAVAENSIRSAHRRIDELIEK